MIKYTCLNCSAGFMGREDRPQKYCSRDCYYQASKKAIPPNPTKTCPRCEIEKPATSEYFYVQQKGKYGLTSVCKQCCLQRQRETAVERNEKLREYRQRPHVKEKGRIRSRLHQRTLKAKETKDRYMSRPEVQQRQREWLQEYTKTEHYQMLYAAKVERRRSKEKGLSANWSGRDWEKCLKYWDHRCCICGRPPDFWHFLAREHWIALNDPRPDNPGTVATNMLPMCHSKKGSNGQGSCNLSKKDKDPEQWLIETYGQCKARTIIKRIQAYFEWIRQQ